jgi:hypothetical protein
MIVFNQEKKDGLEEILLSKASIQLDCQVKPGLNISKASKNESLDIYNLDCVLVSVGWNENDDVFDKIETWQARATPVNKRFNFMHNEKDIIGHITKAVVLDKDGNIIPDDTKEEDLPDFFEISVGSIFYSFWEDKQLQARANKLIEEIPEGKWFVSMEVLFPSFDYALTKGQEQKTIERNEETSFLTKYLRIYNGKGEYEGWKVGRKLKNMFFSGNALVDNPANKRSLITSFNFNGAQASTSIFNEVNMAVDQKDYDKTVAELAVSKKDMESVTTERDLLKANAESLKNDLESAKALNVELKKEIENLKSESAKKEEKLSEVNKSLAEILEKAKDQSRVSTLVSEGVEKSKAEELVLKFSKASDEMFGEVVSLYKTVKPENKETSVSKETSNLEVTKAEKAEADLLIETSVDESDKLLESAQAYIAGFFAKKDTK